MKTIELKSCLNVRDLGSGGGINAYFTGRLGFAASELDAFREALLTESA